MKRDYQALAGKPIGLSLEVLSNLKSKMAGVTGLEPAASGVTGRRSNRLSYTPEPGLAPERGRLVREGAAPVKPRVGDHLDRPMRDIFAWSGDPHQTRLNDRSDVNKDGLSSLKRQDRSRAQSLET